MPRVTCTPSNHSNQPASTVTGTLESVRMAARARPFVPNAGANANGEARGDAPRGVYRAAAPAYPRYLGARRRNLFARVRPC